jgi:hypothetical protein
MREESDEDEDREDRDRQDGTPAAEQCREHAHNGGDDHNASGGLRDREQKRCGKSCADEGGGAGGDFERGARRVVIVHPQNSDRALVLVHSSAAAVLRPWMLTTLVRAGPRY